MATTRSRPRGRETARPNSGGVVAEHLNMIYGIAIGGVVVIIAFLALTATGHVVDLAVQHFMLFYAGVFALIALCASVGAGLVATDRMILNPGHRVFAQSAHRAISFGALAFLVIHIVTEILAQRVHVIDAFVPFLSPFRTFYIGLGTISSDLIILLVITGVMRKRFTGNGKSVWRWRAIHYTSYAAFVFGVWHGLLGGRPGKPYVDWSYGLVVALVALGLAIRILSNSLRPKENLSAPPVAESAGSGSAPMRAASMFAQLGAVRAATPAAAMAAAPGGAAGALAGGPTTVQGATTGPMTVVAALPGGSGYADGPLPAPVYEPGYEGPPRYAGAPRNSGPLPRVRNGPASGPLPRAGTGPLPRPTGAPSGPSVRPAPGYASGPLPRVPGAHSGPSVRPAAGYPSGPMPRMTPGPLPRGPRTPSPAGDFNQSRMVPAPGAGSGPQRRPTGPVPYAGTGPMPRGPVRPPGPAVDMNQPDWDSGVAETDPNLRYRMPGPGLPGYRPSADRSPGGDYRR